jgi:hypothetical protein
MRIVRFLILGAFVAGVAASDSARAQQSLTAFAGVVAGAGGGGSCPATFGMPTGLSFFPPSFPFVNTGGIAPCGYTGAYGTNVGTVGPVTNTQSVAAVPLDQSATSVRFAGTANSTASYGSLGASATASTTGGVTSNSVALFSGMGAATFTDFITASSPLVASLSSGFVRYQITVDGSMSALGTPAAFFFGETYVSLDLQQNTGPIYEIMNATVRRGSSPTVKNGAPPAGWTAATGSLSGGSTFFSLLLPMTWGTQWQLKVGLLSWAYGTSETQFLSTAKITGVTLYDASQTEVTNVTLTSATGTDYLRIGQPTTPSTSVPEPSSLLLMLVGTIALAGMAHRRGRLGC